MSASPELRRLVARCHVLDRIARTPGLVKLITGEVGLEGVEAAFAALGDPETHAKILIDPAAPRRSRQPPENA